MAILSFITRLYHYEDDRLDLAERLLRRKPIRSLSKLHDIFYEDFMQGFCNQGRKATINIHSFSHLLESRRHSGPLWKTSAEVFEAFYAVLRRCYQPGTRNTASQIMNNIFLHIQ